MKNERVLISGGAGYIGSVASRELLKLGYKVRVIDNLTFGGEPLIELLNDENFEFIKGDIRNQEDLYRACKDIDFAVHLAAIVGDPACAVDEDLTRSVNIDGAKLFYEQAERSNIRRFIFASTCSNYGKMNDPSQLVDEESELQPVSLYAETKVEFEKFLLDQPKSNSSTPTILRFSTVYGLSPRPRFDLTVNEFTKEIALGRKLVVFGEQFWRPYCHVTDLARSIVFAIRSESSKVAFQVFNVGDTSENYQKQMIVNEILKQIPDAQVEYVKKNEDPRDYRVSFEKIKKDLGFEIKMNVPQGISQILSVVRDGFFTNPDDEKYKNV